MRTNSICRQDSANSDNPRPESTGDHSIGTLPTVPTLGADDKADVESGATEEEFSFLRGPNSKRWLKKKKGKSAGRHSSWRRTHSDPTLTRGDSSRGVGEGELDGAKDRDAGGMLPHV